MDSLHIHIPSLALDDLAEHTGSAPVGELRMGGDWNCNDKVLQQFSPILVDALNKQNEPSTPFTDHMVLAVASHIASTYGGMRSVETIKGSLAPWQLRRAKEMLADNLAKEVSVQQIAKACGLSLSYFSRAFKNSTGVLPYAWLQTHRVEKGKELLLDASLSLAEISLLCGFADQSHFTRVFTRSTGMDREPGGASTSSTNSRAIRELADCDDHGWDLCLPRQRTRQVLELKYPERPRL